VKGLRGRLLLVTIVLVFAAFVTASTRLTRATELSSISLTGWAFSEFVRQAALTDVLAADGRNGQDLSDSIAILQSKARVVSNDYFVDRLDADSAAALQRAVKATNALTVQQATSSRGGETLDAILNDAQVAYAGAVDALSAQRVLLLRDLRLVEVTLGVLALLLLLATSMVFRQFRSDARRAVRLQEDRAREAESSAARLQDLYEATASAEPDFARRLERVLQIGKSAFGATTGMYARSEDGALVAVSVTGDEGPVPDLLGWAAAYAQDGTATRRERYLAVPVLADGVPCGVLAYARPAGHSTFQPGDEAFLGLMAQWVGQHLEQQRAEWLLRESEARSQSIIRSSLDAIITCDDAGRITEFNPAAEAIFRVSREVAVGRTIGDLIVPPHLKDAHEHGMTRLRATGMGRILGQRLEIAAQRLDGTMFPVELSIVELPTSPAMFAGFVRDITDRTAAERRLQERTQQLDSVFRVSPDGFVMFGSDHLAVDVNPAFLDMTGLTREWLIGATEAQVTEALQRLAAPGQPFPRSFTHGTFDTLHLSRPTPRVLKRSVRLLHEDEGQDSGYVMYFRDVTHETEVSDMKTEFLSTAAHELRTPMASIYGFAELLHTRQLDPEMSAEMIEIIYRQADRLVNLLNELLDLARIEARAGKDFRMLEQPITPLVQRTVEAFTPPSEAGRVHLQLPQDLPHVAMDGEKMQQALGNLISNAFKYSPDGGPVTVSAHNDGRHVVISVQDRGIGMKSEQVARAFERFYRADASGNIPGTGLGLTLVKEIIERHGGQVQLDSLHGIGTRATITLPTHTTAPQGTP